MTDSCPCCLRRDVEPFRDLEGYDGNPLSAYRCPGCGHAWTVRRTAVPEPDRYAVYDDPDAWEADDDFSDYDEACGWR